LRNAIRDLSAGNGDLTRRLPANSGDEIGVIAQSFNAFMESLRQMFLKVREQTDCMSGHVDTIDAASQRLASGSQMTANIAGQNSAAIDELTQSVSYIVGNSRSAADLVRQASSLSSDSATSMRQAVSEISGVSQSMESLTSAMQSLETQSAQIGSIATIIKEIADQTNLLALNAAIEAARAGEQGRGFAVVADEVRKLAERTASATIEIDQKLRAMRDNSGQAVVRADETRHAVHPASPSFPTYSARLPRSRTPCAWW